MGVTGREVTMGIGVLAANSWGVPTSVTKRVYFDSDAGITTPAQYVDDTAFGQQFLGEASIGDFQPAEVTLTGQDYYDHHLYVLEAAAMGSPSAAVISSMAADSLVAYQHIFDLAPATDGVGNLTIATDKVLYVEELTTAKVRGFSWNLGPGGIVQKSFNLIGSKSSIASTVNTRSIVATAVAPALEHRVFRNQGVVRINTQADAVLSATHNLVDVIDATFEFQRPMTPAMVFNQAYTAEPLNDGFPTAQLTLRFRAATTVSTNSFYAACQAGTKMKGQIIFTGAGINSTSARLEQYDFPHLEVVEAPAPVTGGAAQIQPTVRFAAKFPNSVAVASFTFNAPFRLTRVTPRSLVAF